VTTRLPNFALIVTAEPYFAVSAPSEMVVLQNVLRGDTKGATIPVTATLLSRGTYSGAKLEPFNIDPKIPLAVYEARNALRIAQVESAEKYAPDAWARASQTASQMEDYLARKQKDPIIRPLEIPPSKPKDARSIAVKQAAAEKIAAEKRAEAEKLAQQQQQATQREAELNAQQEAAAKRAAESAALAAQEAQARAQAEAAQQKAQQEAAQVRRGGGPVRAGAATIAHPVACSTQLCPANRRYTTRTGGHYGRRSVCFREVRPLAGCKSEASQALRRHPGASRPEAAN